MPSAVLRVSRLMALAVHFEALLSEGVVESYADLGPAATRHPCLAPDLPKRILLLSRTKKGWGKGHRTHAQWRDRTRLLGGISARRWRRFWVGSELAETR